MSVLGLKSRYTVEYGLNLQDFPRYGPSGYPSGSDHILLYIPHLVLIWIIRSNRNQATFATKCFQNKHTKHMFQTIHSNTKDQDM